jgi:hypothetical protein
MLIDVEFRKNGAVCVYGGATLTGDIAAAAKAIGAYENLEALKFVIHDLCEIVSFSFCEKALVDLAAHALGILHTNTRVKSCIVTRNPEVLYAFQSYSAITNRTIAKFENMVDATQWCFAMTVR